MSFNRRGPDRRPDRPNDRPARRSGPGGSDWKPRDQRSGERPSYPPRDRPGGDRPAYPPRDRPSYPPRDQHQGDRPSYPPRDTRDPRENRPFTPRPNFERAPDEGAMSIRLDPRRVNALKHLAGEAGVRPGDLVRQWVEERIDSSRTGAEAPSAAAAESLLSRFESLAARVKVLEAAAQSSPPEAEDGVDTVAEQKPKRGSRVSAAPSSERVALHDEMIALIAVRGPMSAADLATAVTERGRYTPPRSGKPIDAATISQRVSNPTYRARFTRSEGLIGLAEDSGEA